MVNPTMFFDIAADGEPLGCVAFELLQTSFQRQQKTFVKVAPSRCAGGGLSQPPLLSGLH
uniref:Uncharacterized protein n=1 Tax=Piliocolobus tephrosceles TaxID=591936 RepID=A0A8C9GZX8_9PRIM